MIRAPQGNRKYWNNCLCNAQKCINSMNEQVKMPSGNRNYRPQYLFELAKENLELLFYSYSGGLPIIKLKQYFEPILNFWEEAEKLGKEVWTKEQQYTRHTWSVNFDHYITCFWLVGLALLLDIPNDQWERLLKLIGNEGEDSLLDRVIATRAPNRKIGKELCYIKPYARLLKVLDAKQEARPKKLREFVDNWYKELGEIGKSGREKQAVPYVYPYWYTYCQGDISGGAYFGCWCVEAAVVAKIFNIDDSLCLGHDHYPGDLLRPDGPSTHPIREPEPKPKRGFLLRLFGRK